MVDYGAYGDGTTDDTAAINLPISGGNRCGEGCLSSAKAAVVYFPLGRFSPPQLMSLQADFIKVHIALHPQSSCITMLGSLDTL